MADVFALDTNVYIHALRNPGRLALLKRFLLRAGTRVRVHALVALELRSGARTAEHEDAVEALLAPYAERDRVVVPTFDAYLQAGRVLAALGVRATRRPGVGPSSLVADAIIASSCRESNVVFVTGDAADHDAIQRRLRGFRFVTAASVMGAGW